MESYEKLTSFYLGRLHDLGQDKTSEDLLLYDSKDLLTHAVCVGMTGSGKTGLCISLLEEAALDGIPSLVIDPKGDLTNLMLTFPDLAPADFRPWVNADVAARKGLSVDDYAAKQADLWRNGLASWQESGERIARLKNAADFAIFTPGSEAGLPISILSTFAVPPAAILADRDLLQDKIATTATSLLSLLEIDADPLQSREHILIANILEHAWTHGQSLDLGTLIAAIQSPPLTRIGVLELESFYPAKDRFGLAMRLNNLLAAPGFETWLAGTPLDIDQLLYSPTGKPRVSILSIAHLSPSEQMFFVSLLLNETLGWMRTRSGTTSLRAILYMDEIFGYLPPVANPPSKKPFLTLLKQARAFGVGLVLATQNPVDLDYKGLSNMGTWFIGRLQTEQDKERLLDGLLGAGGGSRLNRRDLAAILSGLGERVFLLHNVHEDAPVVFHTRWAMSYLCGPLTRQQIKVLMAARKKQLGEGAAGIAAAGMSTTPAGASSAATVAAAAPPGQPARAVTATAPVLPPGITQFFLPLQEPAEAAEIVYEPALVGAARVHFLDTRKGLEHVQELTLLAPLTGKGLGPDWREALEADLRPDDLEDQPVPGAGFAALPPPAGEAKNYTSWQKDLSDTLYRARRCEIFSSAAFGEYSQPGESERDFRIRLADVAREQRDQQVEKLRKSYEAKVSRMEEKIRRAELTVAKEEDQAKQQKAQTLISVGATLLGAFLGRKSTLSTVGRATTAARGVGRAAKESQDIGLAKENVAAYRQQLLDLQEELQTEIEELGNRFDAETVELSTVSLKPRRTDVEIKLCALTWAPYRISGGSREPAWLGA